MMTDRRISLGQGRQTDTMRMKDRKGGRVSVDPGGTEGCRSRGTEGFQERWCERVSRKERGKGLRVGGVRSR